MTTKTIDLNRFKDAVGFTVTFRKWGNRRKGNKDKITTSADAKQDQATKARIAVTKELIKAKEYDAVCNFMGEIQRWVYENTVPSFFKEGFQLTRLEAVEKIENAMRAAARDGLPALVNDLVKVFPDKIREAQTALGEQFNPMDYPNPEDLPRMFSIEWNWIAFTVPEGLPIELRKAEEDKLQKQFSDAAEQITLALRTGFQELIAHAAERLAPSGPGEKPKIFKDSLIGNLQAFIETFNQRNLLNDVELAQLVTKAKEMLCGVTPEKLRNYQKTKDEVRNAFDGIKTQLDGMIVEAKSRVIEFDSEEAA